jgi:hypothetical protein
MASSLTSTGNTVSSSSLKFSPLRSRPHYHQLQQIAYHDESSSVTYRSRHSSRSSSNSSSSGSCSSSSSSSSSGSSGSSGGGSVIVVVDDDDDDDDDDVDIEDFLLNIDSELVVDDNDIAIVKDDDYRLAELETALAALPSSSSSTQKYLPVTTSTGDETILSPINDVTLTVLKHCTKLSMAKAFELYVVLSMPQAVATWNALPRASFWDKALLDPIRNHMPSRGRVRQMALDLIAYRDDLCRQMPVLPQQPSQKP